MLASLILAAAIAAGAVAPPAPAKTAPFDFAPVLELLHGPLVDKVGLDRVLDTPITYNAWGVWTVARPARQVAAVALDLAAYAKTFRHVHQCEQITAPPRLLGKNGTWYLEGRALRARIWAIGDIDTLWCAPDSSRVRVVAHQNENRVLEQRWRQSLPWWRNYRTHGLKLAALVEPRGPDSCRVGILAQGWVKDPMPEWLTKLAVQYIMPSLFEDLQKEAERRFPVKRKHWFLWW